MSEIIPEHIKTLMIDQLFYGTGLTPSVDLDREVLYAMSFEELTDLAWSTYMHEMQIESLKVLKREKR